MSKISFSKNVSDSLIKKINTFLDSKYDDFFDYDEYFELALCLSYMTLSKEKIIKKDIKNYDRLGRLNNLVDEKEIIKLFSKDFCKDVPIIEYAKEKNYIWILDNIRDCIMHGVFDVDEENKMFIVNNTQYDREIRANIPFSWFIKYTKNDILSKKKSKCWTIKGFYYNSEREDKKSYHTKHEIFKTIMYRVIIYGNTEFNVEDIKKKVFNIFKEVSKEELSQEQIEKYKDKFRHKHKYSDRYLASFAIASERIKEEIENDDIKVNILIDDRKYRNLSYIENKIPYCFDNYNLLIKELNYSVSTKSYELLYYIQKILLNLEKAKQNKNSYVFYQYNVSHELIIQFINKFYGISKEDLIYSDNLNQLKHINELILNILINIYGLTTLVINYDDFYNEKFLNRNPSEFSIKASTKQPIIDQEKNRRNFLEQILDIEIKLFEMKNDPLCPMTKSREKKINKIEAKLESKKEKLYGIPLQIIREQKYYKSNGIIGAALDRYICCFKETTDIEVKKKLKDKILQTYDKRMENEIKYSNAVVFDMNETITIIRNSFSHVGRIYIGENRGLDTILIMHDYDTNNLASGKVITTLGDMLEVLSFPLTQEDIKNKKIDI